MVFSICIIQFHTTSTAVMDYNGTSERVEFTAAGVQCVDIPINMDRVLEEEEEQFSVVLTTTDDAITIGRQFATVTIIDSEGMCCLGMPC